MSSQDSPSREGHRRKSRGAKAGRKRLRIGFSTGTAVAAASRAALRMLLSGEASHVVAVRLPGGFYLPVPVASVHAADEDARATVVKDGGDDPDVTHGAEISVRLRLFAVDSDPDSASSRSDLACICVIGGEGVGLVTKPGLPVAIGEPAVNPVPRDMLLLNLTEEWRRCRALHPARMAVASTGPWQPPHRPHVWLGGEGGSLPASGTFAELEITVPRGAELARHTLNPRLGIVGGISILGTTGLVKPFSHEAYEETIQAALTVARSNGCERVVLSTGGKSENFARATLEGWPIEAFVQIADFFAFSVRTALKMGFRGIVHSVFFGKAVKMAQGHAYTHAHKVAMDLAPLATLAGNAGYGAGLVRALAGANTAQHALNLIQEQGAEDLIQAIARQALDQSAKIGEHVMGIRLLLFDQKGNLLADVTKGL
jgi:cobalt-precorrin-5B (C1)-methyltransferase